MSHGIAFPRGICAACGHWTSRLYGRWCWHCYATAIGDDTDHLARPNPAKEARIPIYRARAERGQPLFTD